MGQEGLASKSFQTFLLQHHAVQTRRWLSRPYPRLEIKGFHHFGRNEPPDASLRRSSSNSRSFRRGDQHLRERTAKTPQDQENGQSKISGFRIDHQKRKVGRMNSCQILGLGIHSWAFVTLFFPEQGHLRKDLDAILVYRIRDEAWIDLGLSHLFNLHGSRCGPS